MTNGRPFNIVAVTNMDEAEALIIHQIVGNVLQAEEDVEVPARQLNPNQLDPIAAMTDDQFIGLFRVDKLLAQEIIDIVTPYMVQGQTYSSLEIKTKVFVTLLFYAHGSYQKNYWKKYLCGISQSSVSRCINEVTMTLNQDNIVSEWIRFPQNINELQDLRARFVMKI
ncbi:hypothetical protein NQ318_008100 [Aromia moschata]|uniref:Transposase Helix-turn-helix domain-containing protein n=1 Tax=Aromia moschata TaxID=1265417 RepID=A0AAV8YLL8_9CUCU|nr:hypothetical protein NQ318_008100 [Aromia moschata]